MYSFSKYYSSGWGGGSVAKIKTFNIAKVGGLFAKGSFGLGIALDAWGVRNYYKYGANDPNAVHPGKAGLNTAMGAYGLWINPVVGALYFGVDAFYPGGWGGDAKNPGALKVMAVVQNRDRQILGYYPKD